MLTFQTAQAELLDNLDTAEAHVTEARQFAPDIALVAQGQRAATMDEVLKEIDIARKVALSLIDNQIAGITTLINNAEAFKITLGLRKVANNLGIETGAARRADRSRDQAQVGSEGVLTPRQLRCGITER